MSGLRTATQPIMIGCARRIMIRLGNPRMPAWERYPSMPLPAGGDLFRKVGGWGAALGGRGRARRGEGRSDGR